jgi:DNA-binding MarR family transcriptional regulator
MVDTPDEPPRWLNQDERLAWISLNGVLIKLPFALDVELRRTGGVSHFDYLVMSALSESVEMTIPMSQLAALTNSSLSRLSHVLTRLATKGWARRVPCPEDRRATNAVLTEAGFAVVRRAAPGHLETVRELVIDALSPAQIRQLAKICQAVLGRLDPEGEWPPEPSRPVRSGVQS